MILHDKVPLCFSLPMTALFVESTLVTLVCPNNTIYVFMLFLNIMILIRTASKKMLEMRNGYTHKIDTYI